MAEVFASVVSLDERETPQTVRDIVEKANRSVRLAVVLQSANGELIHELRSIPEVELTVLQVANARGPVYARALANSYYRGEPYFYQCDAHTLHADGFDDFFIGWLDALEGDKNLISTYAPPSYFEPGTSYITPLYWDDSGLHVTRIDGLENDAPVPARFLGGGQIFAPGRFVLDLPYDACLYFHGEEQSLAIRAWTKGWRIYAPPRVVTWYSNPTEPCPRHWEVFPNSWADLAHIATRRARILFGWEDGNLGPFGVTAEELAAWAEWSGCDPAARTIEPDRDWRCRHGYPG